MSSVAFAPSEPARVGRGRAVPDVRSWRLQALSVLAFSALAMLASLRFASLLAHPSFPRVAAIVAIAAALAAGLLASASLPGRRRSAAAVTGSALAMYLALCCAGLPAWQLLPWHWGLLAHELGRGIGALDGLWPYRGSSPQARAAVMACVAAAVIGAAALVFWPSGAGGLRRRLAALALLLGLYVTAAANQPRTGWQVQALAALAALYLWGWSSRTRRAEDGRAAAWLLAGTVVSVLGAGALAGGPLINVHSWQPFGEPGADTAFNWNQTYRALPWSTSSDRMVEVASGSPHLWRATELDSFDGTRFLASGHPPAESNQLAEEPQHRRWVTTTTFVVRGLSSRLLLSPGQILEVSGEGPSTPELGPPAADGTMALSSVPPGGFRYRTLAYDPQPTVLEMRDAPSSSPTPRAAGAPPTAQSLRKAARRRKAVSRLVTASPRTADSSSGAVIPPVLSPSTELSGAAVPPSLSPYTEFDLPGPAGPVAVSAADGVAQIEASPYAGVYALARHLAAGEPDAYDVAARIEAFLHRGFTYDTHPPPSRYPIVTFLLDNRLGYCQQFSGAMALMLRMDGIPARIGAGFLPGIRSSAGGLFSVTALDAHAWVEVFYGGIGWVDWDPTPEGQLITTAGLGGAHPSAASLAASAREDTSHARARSAPAGHGGVVHRAGGLGAGVAAAAGAGGVLLLVAIALGWARVRRRPREPGGEVQLEELTRALRRLRLEPPTGTTLAELERRLSRSHGAGAGGYLRSLRELRYSPPGSAGPPTANERRLLRRTLSTGRGPMARLRGLFALPPGGRA